MTKLKYAALAAILTLGTVPALAASATVKASDTPTTAPSWIKHHKVTKVGNPHCPESGEEVSSMGKPHTVVYKGYEVSLCCPKCKAQFDKDPDAGLKKALSDAKKAKAKKSGEKNKG